MFDELRPVGKILYVILFPLLWVLSLVYRVLMSLRNLSFDLGIRKVKVFKNSSVISVGNIDVGGTGKTPVTIRISEYLVSKGYKVGVLTRGYRSGLKSSEGVWIKDGQIAPLFLRKGSEISKIYPDEPRLISCKVPSVWVVVGARRGKMADLFMKQTGIDIDWWILDDGFQHRSIHRDVDIVLIDSKKSVSNCVIPCGKSRESVTGLKRASVLLFTRSQSRSLCDKNKKLADRFNKPAYPIVFQTDQFLLMDRNNTRNTRTVEKDFFSAKKISVLSSISKNRQFLEAVVKALGILEEELYYTLFLRDHSRFTESSLLDTGKIASSDVLITTAKDYYRDPEFFSGTGKDTVVLSLTMLIEDKDIEDILVKK